MKKASKSLAAGSLAMAAAIFLSGCSVFHRGPQKVAAADVSFMFMVWAPSGAIQPADTKGQVFTLTLHNPSPSATFFSDKPKRLAAQVPLGQLVTTWGKMGLADAAPNGAVTANAGQATQRSMTGELSDPKFDAQTGDLSFTVKLAALSPATVTPTAFAGPSGDNMLPASFNQVTLLIDPSKYQGVEYIVTGDGVISLRETYAQGGTHPIDVLPSVTYIGPDYFGKKAPAAATK